MPRRSAKRYQKANSYVTVMRVPEWDNIPEPHGIPGRATLQEPVIPEYLRGAKIVDMVQLPAEPAAYEHYKQEV